MKSYFFSVQSRPHHVLNHKTVKNSNYSLRDFCHNLTLSSDISISKRNFIYRMLFTDIYWYIRLVFFDFICCDVFTARC